jgi:hypothetical protein
MYDLFAIDLLSHDCPKLLLISNSQRYLIIGTRYWAGIMTGSDSVTAALDLIYDAIRRAEN